MMARSTALQTEAGYIDARPHLPDRRNLLAPHGRTIHQGQKAPSVGATAACAQPAEGGHLGVRHGCQ
ncbi:hypothetical protein WN72_22250 [Bradyrhizobium arachidis]|uniref:Uncharacterized protein n=1 Tax=Bradyrhizobium arachidis TaxID=858423 RepID=A0AAE7NSL2_9BRAD|nr:hypothetical protein WN72_22250 [Bradyrhizobium arachidis]